MGLLGVVILGAFGSGLWLHGLEPLLRFILRLASLGFDTYKDDVYKEIARGLHEYASHAVLGVITSIWVGLLLGLVFGLYFTMRFSLALFSKLQSDIEGTEKGLVKPETVLLRVKTMTRDREKLIRSGKKWLYAYGLLVVYFSTMQLIAVARHTYINSAVTHFHQVLRIASPYLDKSEQAVIVSQFAQVKSKEDYARIVDRLADTAKTNGQNIPPFDPW